MKKLIAVILVFGIGGGAYAFWASRQKSKSAASNPSTPTTAAVELRSIEFAVTIAGDIGPADQVSVRPEITGRLLELPVDIGDYVTNGTLLCRLDDRDLQTTRSARVTDIEGARLQLEKAERNYERSKRLVADKLIPQETFDDTQTDYELAKNDLERTRKALVLVDDQIAKTRILAPFDCTILTRPVSIGQAVSGSGGNNGGTEIMTIANLKNMIVNSHVNQADVARMTSGQTTEIEVEAVPGLKMNGVVECIAPQATFKNGIKGFATRIQIKDIDKRVRPGMTANVTIPLISANNVLAVPLAAVFTEQNERYVFVQKDDEEFEARPVQIGVADYQYAEIVTGVSTGEVVSLIRPAAAPPLELKPGRTRARAKDTTTASGPTPAGKQLDGGKKREGPGAAQQASATVQTNRTSGPTRVVQ